MTPNHLYTQDCPDERSADALRYQLDFFNDRGEIVTINMGTGAMSGLCKLVLNHMNRNPSSSTVDFVVRDLLRDYRPGWGLEADRDA